MKRSSTTGLLSVSFLALLATSFYWHNRHSFESMINRNSEAACGYRRPCTFTLGDVFPGDWDHVVVFEMGACQDEIDATIGKGAHKPDLRRLIVFARNGRVDRTMTASEGVEHPEPGEVVFDGVPTVQEHFSVGRNEVFVKEGGAPKCEDCTTLMLLRPGQVVE
jgi:hypothetical protein